jgi:hypothetical protein
MNLVDFYPSLGFIAVCGGAGSCILAISGCSVLDILKNWRLSLYISVFQPTDYG